MKTSQSTLRIRAQGRVRNIYAKSKLCDHLISVEDVTVAKMLLKDIIIYAKSALKKLNQSQEEDRRP